MKKEKEEIKLIQCPEPGCTTKLPENDFQGQIRHMEYNHPNSIIVENRMKGIKRRDYNG